MIIIIIKYDHVYTCLLSVVQWSESSSGLDWSSGGGLVIAGGMGMNG